MVALLREASGHGGLTPDGPKGPVYEVQPGLIALAQKTGRPILPVTLSADRVHRFASWDRFLVPKPFARVRLTIGAPITVSPERDTFDAERQRVQDTLRAMTATADGACGIPVDTPGMA